MTRPGNDTLDGLCAFPGIATAMLATSEVRDLLRSTGGWVMVNGHMWDFVTEARGAGMYTVKLKLRVAE